MYKIREFVCRITAQVKSLILFGSAAWVCFTSAIIRFIVDSNDQKHIRFGALTPWWQKTAGTNNTKRSNLCLIPVWQLNSHLTTISQYDAIYTHNRMLMAVLQRWGSLTTCMDYQSTGSTVLSNQFQIQKEIKFTHWKFLSVNIPCLFGFIFIFILFYVQFFSFFLFFRNEKRWIYYDLYE